MSLGQLEKEVSLAPILGFPEFGKGVLILDTDASNFAMGAVLSQVIKGDKKVIACASQAFSNAERLYCTMRKELLAIATFVERFRCYLQGLEFVVCTDHQVLKYLMSFKEPMGQLAWWLKKLQDLNFMIQHQPGKQHVNADALFRLCPRIKECPTCLIVAMHKQSLTNCQDNAVICDVPRSSAPMPVPRAKPQLSCAIAPSACSTIQSLDVDTSEATNNTGHAIPPYQQMARLTRNR